MVKPIVVAIPTGSLFWWNLDSNVGAKSPNKKDDVQFVQFGYFCMSINSKNATSLSSAERAAIAKIKIGAPCTGQEDDPLVVAIRAHEKSRGGAQDGHVSVVPPGMVRYDGKHSFILNVLATNILEVTKHNYPRFFDHTALQRAVELKKIVKTACGS